MAEESEHEQLITHLRDAQALEEQAIKQLERACQLAGDDELKHIYRERLEQSHEHQEQIAKRIEAHEEKASAVRDLTMRSGVVGLRQLADIPPDTPLKLAMHFYALANLEVASYQMLCQIARQTGDDESAETAQKILEQEREAVEKVQGTFDRSVELTLEAEQKAAQEREEESEEEQEESEEEQEESEADSEEEPSGQEERSEEEPSGEEERSEEESSGQEERSDEQDSSQEKQEAEA